MTRFLFGFVPLLAAAVVALGLGRPEPRALSLSAHPAPSPLYAVDYGVKGGRLVRLDPATLKARPGPSVRLFDQFGAWSFSPDRRRLALGSEHGSIRIVDVARMRSLGHVHTGVGGTVFATLWLPPRRLLALVDTTLVAIDPVTRRVLSRTTLRSWPEKVARTRDGLVLLLRPPTAGVGDSMLAVADRDGNVRTVPLPGILSGMDEFREDGGLVRQASPGLTVDPVGNRAFVFAAGAPAVAVDLDTLAVESHSLGESRSILGRLHDWLEPKAEAKGAMTGPRRTARWLGNGSIAVWGTDDEGTVDAGGHGQVHQAPAGLAVVDTRDWSMRMLDRGASEATVADGLILASAYLWDSTTQRARGMGLAAYGPDGSRRFHVLGSQPLTWVEPVGRTAIVSRQDRSGAESYVVVDLDAGRAVRELRPKTSFVLLNGEVAPWLG